MFDNIGQKIKLLAKIITWVFIGFSVIVGIVTFSKSLIAGILVIVIGAVISWVGSFLLYGFGELIDNTSKIQQNLDDTQLIVSSMRNEVIELKILESQKKQQVTYIKQNESTGEQMLYCKKCGRENIPSMTYCSSCGSKLQ